MTKRSALPSSMPESSTSSRVRASEGVAVDSYETLLYEERDGVAVVTLNRPDVHNAFNDPMQQELRQVWRSLRTNDDVRAVVLTGAGEKAFCSGLDRAEMSEDYLANPAGQRLLGRLATPFMFKATGP